MSYKTLILLFFATFAVFAQTEEKPLLSISPIFSVGVSLPSKVDITSGNEKLSYIPSTRITGSLVNSAGGTTAVSIYLTNTIGFETNYHFKSPQSISFGITRSSQINSMRNPYEFPFAGAKVSEWYGVFRYFNFNFSAQQTWVKSNEKQYFGKICLSYSTGFSSPLASDPNNPNISGNFVENGTGVRIEAFNLKNSTFLLTPEIGYRAHEYLPLDLSFAITIPTTSVYSERYRFFKSFQETGTNLVNLNQSVLWLKARYTFDVLKRKERYKPERKPKIEEKKPTPIITKKEKVNFGDKKIEEGEKIILKNIQFEQTKWTLNPSAMGELDRLVELMKTYPKMRIEITGHTSSEGDRNDNIELSRKRAESCKDYLKKNGIESNRILTRGIGPDSPISSTDKSLNRRVEFSVIRVN